ncbi:MAG: tetratricopeptide repeat protein [Clostridia bacterium]|nr:tetratricopeptide repeat protein [Clostridia bacterium]
MNITSNIKTENLAEKKFSTLLLLRCTTLNYAQKFLKTGNIRFAKPKEWIEAFETDGKGRGDLLEGAFAGCLKYDKRAEAFYRQYRPNVECRYVDSKQERCVFQSKNVINMRAFCLFGLNDNIFTEKTRAEDHKWYPYGTITKQYFNDFLAGLYGIDESNYESVSEDKKPALIFINNPHEFFKRVRKYFENIGLKQDEYIIAPVSYSDKNKNFLIGDRMPGELYSKDKSFEYQSEIRIVVTSQRPEVVSFFDRCNGIVDLGAMDDIASISDYYFNDIVMQKRNEKQIVLNLPQPITKEITLADHWMYMIYVILKDEVAYLLFKDDATIDDEISKMASVLLNDFNIIYDKDRYMFYKTDMSVTWQIDVNDVWNHLYEHGCYHQQEREYEYAIRSFEKSIKFRDGVGEVWFRKGVCHFELNQVKEALAAFDKALALNYTNSDILTIKKKIMESCSF